MEEVFQFREVLNESVVNKIADDIAAVYPVFDQRSFVQNIIPQISKLSLNDRSNLITENLFIHLPKEYPVAAKIILKSFGPELTTKELSGFDIFYYMPHGSYVARYGIALEHFEISMNVLYEITKRFSSESPVRPFLIKYPERTLQQLKNWVTDKNVHVRRLVSEGTRPRLPLSGRLSNFQKDPTPVLELLEQLKADPELYVRRSVANNLNDISKDNPDIVVKTLKSWQKNTNPETLWIINHASRTLLKKGHSGALKLLGFDPDIEVSVSKISIEPETINMGQDIEFSFKIHSQSEKEQRLMIDYIIHFMKANGKTAPKVFKLTQKVLAKKQSMSFSKRHSFKKISTRVYYPGLHYIEIQINGNRLGKYSFTLKR